MIGEKDVRDLRLREMPQMGWIDSVRRVLDAKGMSMEQDKRLVLDRDEWRAVLMHP